MTDKQDTDATARQQGLLCYFLRMRSDRIARYKAAVYLVTRADMRSQALHFGRLARGLS